MASAILTSRNDPRSSGFITKFVDNSNLNYTRLQSVQNPNPNTNFSHFFNGNTGGRDVIRHHQLSYSASQQAAFIGSPINSVPANFNRYRYITFRLSSYSKTGLKNLKKGLMSDLERVRIVRQWICSTSIPKTHHHAPELELPAAPGVAVGQKRTNPLPPARDTKKQCGRTTNVQRRKMMMRECGQILVKLMKHKHGWVFNTPVDAAALKLYDYHNIINNPMDLGTIKYKLARNEYESIMAFASDVRLTFRNAMVYNGKGSDVFIMAERLLLLFEDLFSSIQRKFGVNELHKQNWCSSVETTMEMARVSKKREMTDEEKWELAESFSNLQLGPEGMDQIMAIVKKGVLGLEHQGDEIELDLAVLDNDTLWGLHSFVSRTRANSISSVQIDNFPGNESVVEEEDVDIGEEMQSTVFPPVEIEKDVVNVGGSESSSGSDSSSSADSWL